MRFGCCRISKQIKLDTGRGSVSVHIAWPLYDMINIIWIYNDFSNGKCLHDTCTPCLHHTMENISRNKDYRIWYGIWVINWKICHRQKDIFRYSDIHILNLFIQFMLFINCVNFIIYFYFIGNVRNQRCKSQFQLLKYSNGLLVEFKLIKSTYSLYLSSEEKTLIHKTRERERQKSAWEKKKLENGKWTGKNVSGSYANMEAIKSYYWTFGFFKLIFDSKWKHLKTIIDNEFEWKICSMLGRTCPFIP